MPIGIVKWFNNAKGYGFICSQEGELDIFAHFSAIVMNGYKCLKASQMVTFELNEGPKGLHASNIQPHPLPDQNISLTQTIIDAKVPIAQEDKEINF